MHDLLLDILNNDIKSMKDSTTFCFDVEISPPEFKELSKKYHQRCTFLSIMGYYVLKLCYILIPQNF